MVLYVLVRAVLGVRGEGDVGNILYTIGVGSNLQLY